MGTKNINAKLAGRDAANTVARRHLVITFNIAISSVPKHATMRQATPAVNTTRPFVPGTTALVPVRDENRKIERSVKLRGEALGCH